MADNENAVVAAASLVLLLAPTSLSPLRCRAGVAHIVALACALHGAPLSGCLPYNSALFAPLRLVIVHFVVAAMLFELTVVLVSATRHGSGFAPIVGRHHHRRLVLLTM